MGEHDVRAHELTASRDIVFDERTSVGEELQVQLGDAPAGIALAARRHRDRALPPGESEVAGLNRRDEPFTVHLTTVEAEDRVPFQLGELERPAQLAGDDAQEVDCVSPGSRRYADPSALIQTGAICNRAEVQWQ
jgi:hypothetical protein